MARPPSEWPIPVYDLELRERLIACYTAPAAAMLHHVPAPLTPAVIGGRAFCSVTLASGRVLKRAGVSLELASEFHLLEVQTPVAWPRPCIPAERGLFTLLAGSDHPGLNRLLSRCANKTLEITNEPSARVGKVQLADGFRGWPGGAAVSLASGEPDWPASSIIDGLERSEVLLAHPAYRFFVEAEGSGVRAVPVRDYARSTRLVDATVPPIGWVAGLFGVEPGEVMLDHTLLQKRVTQTVFFPSERIVASPRCAPVVRRASTATGLTPNPSPTGRGETQHAGGYG